MLARSALLGLAVLPALLSCYPDEEPPIIARKTLVLEEGCQPLLARNSIDDVSRGTCLLPYPSDFYRRDGKVSLTGKAKLTKATGEPADIHDVVPMDGFSLVPTIVATLPSAVVRDGLPSILADPTLSASAASATVILDAERGTFIPHYTDKPDLEDAEHEPLILRPFAPLLPNHRYVVALKGVRLREKDELAPPPDGFQHLRDGKPDKVVDGLRDRFDRDIFSPLERAGIPRKDLQLAWDFTTGSAEAPQADLLRVRELTLAWLVANPPVITVTESKVETDRLFRTVQGTITAPLFLDRAGVGGRLFRGADGKVAQNGTTTFPFTATVPNTVNGRTQPGRALLIGHGFFGGRDEIDGNPSRNLADKLGAVEFAIDWWGMTKEDVARVANGLGDDPAHGCDFTERVHQAMANWLVLTAAIKGPMTQVKELTRSNGEPFYDPTFISYFGASQGHILGGTLAALDANLKRVVLNVGGGAFTHIMPRSGNFGPFSLVLDFAFKDPLSVQAYIAAFQRAIDRIDPATYAPMVITAERKVLMQIGIGDQSIPNAASFLHAAALGVKLTMPSPKPVFGLMPAEDPKESALTLFDYHVDISAWERPQPLSSNPVHDTLRLNPRAVRQIDEFLQPDGVVVHPCDGPCDPE